jgi:hypothetical protein
MIHLGSQIGGQAIQFLIGNLAAGLNEFFPDGFADSPGPFG